MIGAGEMVKLRGPQRPSLRLQSCWPPAPSRRARLAVHTVGASFGPSSRNLVQYSQHKLLAVLQHSFAASRALRVRNRYRKTKTSQSVQIPQIFATLVWNKSTAAARRHRPRTRRAPHSRPPRSVRTRNCLNTVGACFYLFWPNRCYAYKCTKSRAHFGRHTTRASQPAGSASPAAAGRCHELRRWPWST